MKCNMLGLSPTTEWVFKFSDKNSSQTAGTIAGSLLDQMMQKTTGGDPFFSSFIRTEMIVCGWPCKLGYCVEGSVLGGMIRDHKKVPD